MLTLTDNARTAVQDLTAQAGVPEGGGLRIAEDLATDRVRMFPGAVDPQTGRLGREYRRASF